MNRIVFFLFFCSIHFCGFNQNYREYHQIFHRIDEDVLTQNAQMATFRLDSVLEKFDFVYAKHCMKAIQICLAQNDSIRANLWLEKAFKQGIPIWLIQMNEGTRNSLILVNTQETIQKFDQFHTTYLNKIDQNLNKTIDSLLVIDQKFTQRMNRGSFFLLPIYWVQWGIQNKKQGAILKSIIEKQGYPEEKMLGLPHLQDSIQFNKYLSFWGPSELRDARVQIMLQHCFSTWHPKDVKFAETLIENLSLGNIPPTQLGILLDFMFPNREKYADFNFGFREIPKSIPTMKKVNINRFGIGLNSLEQEQRNTLIERERRKSRTINKEIMLE